MAYFFSFIVVLWVGYTLACSVNVVTSGMAVKVSMHDKAYVMAHKQAVISFNVSVVALIVLIEIGVLVLGRSNRDEFFWFHMKLAIFFIVMLLVTQWLNGFRFSYHWILASITTATFIVGVAPTGMLMIFRRIPEFEMPVNWLIEKYTKFFF